MSMEAPLAITVLVSFIETKFGQLLDWLISKINQIFNRFSEDAHKIVASKNPIDPSLHEWTVHYSLMQAIDASSQSATEKTREKLRFLAANYLYKNAPRPQPMRQAFSELSSHFHENGVTKPTDSYHRSYTNKLTSAARKINKAYALGNDAPLILTDTLHIQHLFPLKFIATDGEPHAVEAAIEKMIATQFAKPILIDLTPQMGDCLTDDKRFRPKFKQFKFVLSEIIRDIAKKSNEDASQLKKRIFANISCIASLQTDQATGIKALPITLSQVGNVSPALELFVVSTGIGMGSVPFRSLLIEEFTQETGTLATGKKGDTPLIPALLYQSPLDLLNTRAFSDFNRDISSPSTNGATSLFGKMISDALSALLNKTTAIRWNEIHRDTAKGQALQITLFRIQQQLAEARLALGDYNSFMQKIELIYAGIGTLLDILQPYNDDAFSEIFLAAIEPQIPSSLKSSVRTHLGKTAVNTCAAILAAKPDANRTFSDGLYFEEMFLTGAERRFDNIIGTAPLKSIDLYFGQFNSNIEIAHDFTHYKRRDIAKDVQTLLTLGLAADHLTVAVDCTIDKLPSDNVRDLLQTFEQEIKDGKLNFIFFESGVKVAQFGMDTYAGSPFYLVNNGGPQWSVYNEIGNHPAHKTDRLSAQWFALAYDKLLDPLREYRQIIFDNTRAILDAMPDSFLPDIRVNTAAKDMDTAFIDIKISGRFNRARAYAFIGKLYKELMERNVRVHQRASFGFYHVNANIIEHDVPEAVKTIRLTIGANKEENETLINFFRNYQAERSLPTPAVPAPAAQG